MVPSLELLRSLQNEQQLRKNEHIVCSGSVDETVGIVRWTAQAIDVRTAGTWVDEHCHALTLSLHAPHALTLYACLTRSLCICVPLTHSLCICMPLTHSLYLHAPHTLTLSSCPSHTHSIYMPLTLYLHSPTHSRTAVSLRFLRRSAVVRESRHWCYSDR